MPDSALLGIQKTNGTDSACLQSRCCFPQPGFGQSDLPPSVQADLLKTQIVDAMGRKTAPRRWRCCKKYHGLNVEMPPVLLYQEARLAAERDDVDGRRTRSMRI